MPSTRQLLVTYALPYANGALHLGHLTGFIQTDIWVRFQKMCGHDCLFICGCDSHGTPIMIQAEKMHITPEQLITDIRESHIEDLKLFYINVDNYYTTHSDENKELVELIFKRHVDKGNIIKHTIKQAFDPEKKMFLPDRYIKGECPRCKSPDQYGDSCEICGATYAPTELNNAYSTLSGAKPIEKESEHYFFKLQNYDTFLHQWTRAGHLQEEVTHKLDEWFKTGLKEWDISRDAPYFGFTIPDEKDKYFYCWLDAPVGYMASFKQYCSTHPDISFDDYWKKENATELYHFIGKDITYFHTLFWPALLEGASFRTPTAIFCHGFLTIGGQKMSKSRGTFIKARTYADYLPPEYLRYYLATKLSARIEDLDLQFDDFMQRVNADLVGKYVNIASRSASFIHKYFSGKLANTLSDPALYDECVKAGEEIANKFKEREFNQAIRHIMLLADRANQYIDEKKPWSAIKEEKRKEEVHGVCTLAINLFRLLTLYLKPVLPEIAKKVETFLEIEPLTWAHKNKPLLDHSIQPFQPLATRIEKTQIDALILSLKDNAQS